MQLLFRLALSVAVAAGSALAATPAKAAPSTTAATTAAVVRKPTAPTSGGYPIEATITFAASAPTTQFRLEFDLPANTYVSPWDYNGFSSSGSHWTLNFRSPTPQRAGGTYVLTATILGTGDPVNCRIDGNACVYRVETDTEAPTTPPNFTATRRTGTSPWGPYANIYLTWGSSTDNYRLAGYEVSANGQVIETFYVNIFSMYPTYTAQQVTYSIRSFDSVGNYSPSATVTLPAL